MILRHHRRWVQKTLLRDIFREENIDTVITNLYSFILQYFDHQSMACSMNIMAAKIAKLFYGDRIRSQNNFFEQLLVKLSCDQSELQIYTDVFGRLVNDNNVIEYFSDPLSAIFFRQYCYSGELIFPLLRWEKEKKSSKKNVQP